MRFVQQVDNPNEYETLREPVKVVLQKWIQLAIVPAKTVRNPRDSYSLKHEFERQTDIYTTNGQFKGAMLAAGYTPVNEHEQNWIFKIKRANSKFKPQMVLDPQRDPVFEYSIAHISKEERDAFNQLVKRAFMTE